MKSIRYVPHHDSDDFSLIFKFEENDYFSNSELKKTFIMNPKYPENPIKSEGSVILWKESKNITKKTVKRVFLL